MCTINIHLEMFDLGLVGLVDKVVGGVDLQAQEGVRLHAEADGRRLHPALVSLPPSVLKCF